MPISYFWPFALCVVLYVCNLVVFGFMFFVLHHGPGETLFCSLYCADAWNDYTHPFPFHFSILTFYSQVLLPLLKSDLYEVLKNTLQANLASDPPVWLDSSAAVTVVMASEGYPGAYKKGVEITGVLLYKCSINVGLEDMAGTGPIIMVSYSINIFNLHILSYSLTTPTVKMCL